MKRHAVFQGLKRLNGLQFVVAPVGVIGFVQEHGDQQFHGAVFVIGIFIFDIQQ